MLPTSTLVSTAFASALVVVATADLDLRSVRLDRCEKRGASRESCSDQLGHRRDHGQRAVELAHALPVEAPRRRRELRGAPRRVVRGDRLGSSRRGPARFVDDDDALRWRRAAREGLHACDLHGRAGVPRGGRQPRSSPSTRRECLASSSFDHVCFEQPRPCARGWCTASLRRGPGDDARRAPSCPRPWGHARHAHRAQRLPGRG